MMLWVQLPEGADTWKALDHAVDADVKYNPGGVFRADRGCNNYLRLTYSHNTPEEIHEGIKTLAEVFRQEGFFE
jgi:2-aminoadipate transaminase